MRIDDSFYRDFIVSNPATGVPQDADSLPVAQIFEDDNDTPIYLPTVTKRTGLDGHYKINVVCSAANGFEEGKSYALVITATVSGTTAKAVIFNFIIDDMTKTDIAANITPITIPEDFVPDMTLYPKPVAVPTMDERFGRGSGYPYTDVFTQYYDQVSKIWKTDDEAVVLPGVRGDITDGQYDVDLYQSRLSEWNRLYTIEREVQWRVKVAYHLKNFASSHES